MKTIIFTNKHGLKFRVDNMELAEAVEKYRPSIGEDARWLPSYLEGAETRSVLIKESTEIEEAEYILEYLHPAEYTYEIIEESLEVIKAKKLAELSEKSLDHRKKDPLGQDYVMQNYCLDFYDSQKKNDIKALHKRYRDNYYRLVDVVNACTSEEEVNNIGFSLQ